MPSSLREVILTLNSLALNSLAGDTRMYIDSYVISSLVIIALTVVILGYMAWYAYRHIKRDRDAAGKSNNDQRQ